MKSSRIFFFIGIVLILMAVIVMRDWQPTLAQENDEEMNLGAAIFAVDLIEAWVDAGASESDLLDYVGQDGNTYQATFEIDILPVFTKPDIWFPGSPACISCHFANTEASYHEMNLTNYIGLRTGVDVLSEPPGISIFGESEPFTGDFDWENAELRHRLRDNRMPPGSPFDITEANRDGPTLDINGVDVRAVDLIGDWVNAGAPETDAFGDYGANFETNVLPLFTEASAWFEGSQACASCHYANSPESPHEMNLSSYAGIRAGADILSEPPGVSILGESESNAGDFDWENSELRHRLRDNRMPPGAIFLLDESNRDGPYVLHGEAVQVATEIEIFGTGECEVYAVNLIGTWVESGAPNGAFEFAAEDGSTCDGDFAADVSPLFTKAGAWSPGSPACVSCHFANSENSFHEMNLNTYEGTVAGADVLSEPPGVSILGQNEDGSFDWESSELRHRLRDNRMPPGSLFDITEANRDGPTVSINGVDVRAVDLVGAWVDAGAPETDVFGDYSASFESDVLPLFTTEGAWFEGSPACSSCHFDNTAESYHEMNLLSYLGIRLGADVNENPPGESILGESEPNAGDFDWDNSKLRGRLRDNRMPPGSKFLLDESNRDGPIIMAGTHR
jgi:hypothetical protein